MVKGDLWKADEETPIENLSSQQARHRLVKNWGIEEQRKIYQSRVMVVGSDILGQMVLGCLAGLGVGNILFMDNTRSSPLDVNFIFPKLPYSGLKKSEHIERILRQINPVSNIYGIHTRFSPSIIENLGFNPEFIIEASNERENKEMVLEYALDRGCNLISSYGNEKLSSVSVLSEDLSNPDEITDDSLILETNERRGGITSGVAAGIMVDELKKKLFSLEESDRPLESRLIYNLESNVRKGVKSDFQLDKSNYDSRVLVAGAGAIGNYVAFNLAVSGFSRIDVVDFDEIEDTNLARQIFFYGRVGKSKAEVLAERIKEVTGTDIKGINSKIGESSSELFKERKYSMIFGCFDNNRSRYALSNLAVNFGIPYFDGGSSPMMGTVSNYIPGYTKCIDCKKNLKNQMEKSSSCPQALPSVIFPNIIAGSAMVGEALNFINGNFSDSKFTFDSLDRDRIYTSPEASFSKNCRCEDG